LWVAGCAPAGSASIQVEPGIASLAEDGALRESIGIETLGGVFTQLLDKGCKLPCTLTQIFSTAEDGQAQILLHLYRGDAASVRSTHPLGTVQIAGIAPMPRGEPSILVEFRADTDGITLRATDNKGGSRLSLALVAPELIEAEPASRTGLRQGQDIPMQPVASIEEAKRLVDSFEGSPSDFRLLIPDQLNDAMGAGMAIITDRILARGWEPDGVVQEAGYRVYTYKASEHP
jgi:molecular chaperone DnaK